MNARPLAKFLLTLCCAIQSAGALAQETTVAQSKFDNLYIRQVDLATNHDSGTYRSAGRSTTASAIVDDDIYSGGAYGHSVEGLLFPVPVNLQGSHGALQASATAEGVFGEIGTSARGQNTATSSAQGKVRQEVHVSIDANSALVITGAYSASVLSGTDDLLSVPGLTQYSVTFYSLSAPGAIDVSFDGKLFGAVGTAGESITDGFRLYAENNSGYAIEGMLIFESESYVSVSAVPEPGTWMMLGAGMLILGAARRRMTRG